MKRNKFLFLSIIFLVLFLLVIVNLSNVIISNLDNAASSWSLNNQISPAFYLSKIFHVIFEPKLIVVLIFLFSIILWFKSKKKFAIQLFSTAVIAGILIYILKDTLQRARPITQLISETGFSFPSGHALVSLILFSFLIIFFLEHIKGRSLRITLVSLSVIFVVLVGLSRVYLNVHWFSDVIGSWFLGLMLVFLSRISFKD